MMKKALSLVMVMVLLLVTVPSFAQDEADAELVTLTADDGLDLVADFYLPDSDEPVPTVILLHMLRDRRQSWSPIVPDLVDAGYAVLAIDMRGHGETGGDMDWELAEVDLQAWIDWARAQEGTTDAIALMGGSIGANMALRGMANDPEVVTAVALSPGLNYQNVTTADAVEAIGDRPIFLMAARADNPSGANTIELVTLTQGETQFRLFNGRTHGTRLLQQSSSVQPMIIEWLDQQF